MARIEIDASRVALTEVHVFELVGLKRGASGPVYFLLAKLADAVERIVAEGGS